MRYLIKQKSERIKKYFKFNDEESGGSGAVCSNVQNVVGPETEKWMSTTF
jgi:hypothetical protein